MIRIGIVGAGPNAAGHAHYFAQSSRSRVVAVADPDQSRAVALAAEVQAEPLADAHELLDRVDAVVISSPNFLHREHAAACADAGKHVYCEKPLGLTLADARAIDAAVTGAGVASVVGFSVRFDPVLQTMQRLVQADQLGPLVSLCSRRLVYIDPATATGWRRDQRLSGGLLMEINIHELDWMLALGGPVESVYARTWAAESDAPRANDHLWVTLTFAGGAVGTHEGGWRLAQPQFYRSIQGTRAGLCTDEWGGTLFLAHNGADRVALDLDPAFDLRGHFLDCIEQRAAPVADTRWGVQVMAVTEAIFESAASGQPVAVKDLR